MNEQAKGNEKIEELTLRLQNLVREKTIEVTHHDRVSTSATTERTNFILERDQLHRLNIDLNQ